MSIKAIIFLMFFLSFPLLTFTKSKKNSTGSNTKSSCLENEIKHQDCRLHAEPHSLRISESTIILNDSVRHSVHPFPYPNGTGWEKIHFEKLNDRHILTVEVWTASQLETTVESLNWVILEVVPGNIIQHQSQVVRKRRATEKDGQPLLISGPSTYHKLSPIKNSKKIKWASGRHSGTF